MLIRNIAGLTIAEDTDTLKCDSGGCTDAGDGGIVQDYRPMVGSGVFPPVQMYPYEPIAPATVNVETPSVQPNTLPVPGAQSAVGLENKTLGLAILAGLALLVYMGSDKKSNNTELALYAGGVGLLYYRLTQRDKAVSPVNT